MIFAPKSTKFPNFTRFLPENARILHNNCPKNIFSRILGEGGGHVPPCFHVSYVYDTIYGCDTPWGGVGWGGVEVGCG